MGQNMVKREIYYTKFYKIIAGIPVLSHPGQAGGGGASPQRPQLKELMLFLSSVGRGFTPAETSGNIKLLLI